MDAAARCHRCQRAIGESRGQQCSSAVHQHDVALEGRPGLSKPPVAISALRARSPPRRSSMSAAGTPKSAGVHWKDRKSLAGDLEHQCRPRSGHFVQTVTTITPLNDKCAFRSKPSQRLGHKLGGVRGRRANQLPRCARRIGKRAKQIEHGSHLQLQRARAGRVSWRDEAGERREIRSRFRG